MAPVHDRPREPNLNQTIMNNEFKFQALQGMLQKVSSLGETDIDFIASAIANQDIEQEEKVAILESLVKLYSNGEKRICSATGQLMSSGYVWRDGEKYFSTTKLAAQFLRGMSGYNSCASTSDEDLLNDAYEADDMYYTEFE